MILRDPQMTRAEKLLAATTAGAEERAVLVRDVDPLVAIAVLGNPQLTDAEVETFAAMPDVNVNVLVALGTKGDPGLGRVLLRNPGTPMATARRILDGLPVADLEGVAADPAVPARTRECADLRRKTLPPTPR
jgi:hypothetical protein